jgi:hypothetical protein
MDSIALSVGQLENEIDVIAGVQVKIDVTAVKLLIGMSDRDGDTRNHRLRAGWNGRHHIRAT